MQGAGQTVNVPGFVLERVATQLQTKDEPAAYAAGMRYVLDALQVQVPAHPTRSRRLPTRTLARPRGRMSGYADWEKLGALTSVDKRITYVRAKGRDLKAKLAADSTVKVIWPAR